MDLRDGSRRTRTLLVAAALVVQLVIIGSVIAGPLITSVTGQTIRLAVAPVDPRDPLRGDYLAVRYDISRLRTDNFTDDSNYRGVEVTLKNSVDVWVPLSRKGDVWVQSAYPFTHEPTYAELGRVGAETAIKGKVVSAKAKTIEYGIDRYFVAEGSGTAFPAGKVVAEVMLGRDGTPVLKRIFVGGKLWPQK